MVVDTQGQIVFFNEAAERLSGFSAEEAVGKADFWRKALPDPVLRRRVLGETTAAMREGRDTEELEAPFRTRSGEERLLAWRTAILRDAGGTVVGGLGVGRDVTDLRCAERALERRRRQVQAFNSVSLEIVLAQDLAKTLRAVPQMLCDRVGADAVTLFVHGVPGAPEHFLFGGGVPPFVRKVNLEAGLSQAHWNRSVIRTGKPKVVRDLRRAKRRPVVRAYVEAGFRSGVTVPVIGRQGVLGALTFISKVLDHFTEDVDFLTGFGRELGLMIEHGLLVRQLVQRERHLEVLNTAIRAVALADDLEAGLQEVPRVLRGLVESRSAILFLREWAGRPVRFVDGPVPPAVLRAFSDPSLSQAPVTRQAIRTGQPVIIDDLRRPEFRRRFGRHLLRYRHLSLIVVPVTGRTRLLGTLEFGALKPGHFTRADQAFLTTVAREVGMVIEHRLMERRLVDRERRLDALNEVVRAVILRRDLDRGLRQVPRILRRMVGAGAAVLFVATQPGQPPRAIFDGSVPPVTREILAEPGLPRAVWTQQVMRTGRPVVIADFRTSDAAQQAVAGTLEAGFRSFVSVPVASQQRVLGTLEFASKEPGYFTAPDTDLLTTLGREIGLVIEHRLVEEQLADRERRLEAINEVTHAVMLAKTVEQGLRKIPRILRRVVAADVACLVMKPEAHVSGQALFDGFVPPDARRVLGEPGLPRSPLPGSVMETGKPLLIPDLRDPAFRDQVTKGVIETGFRSALIVPVAGPRRRMGVLGFGSKEARFFSGRDLALMNTVGREIGLVIEHRLVEEQLADREGRLAALSSELARAAEEERHSVAAMLHDDLGQLLSLARVQIDLAGRRIEDPERLTAGLGEAGAHIDAALAGVRRLASRLEPEILADFEVVEALRKAVRDLDESRKEAISFTLRGSGPRPAPYVERALFRIIMEAIQNALRHARACAIRVRATWRPERLTISVRDDGRGFEPREVGSTAAGLGLRLMRDRADQIGADLHIRSARGKGTMVRAAVSLAPNGADP